jgi:hypothetical protein
MKSGALSNFWRVFSSLLTAHCMHFHASTRQQRAYYVKIKTAGKIIRKSLKMCRNHANHRG